MWQSWFVRIVRESKRRAMSRKPRRPRTSPAICNAVEEVILLEDLAPLNDVKGGMIVFGLEESPMANSPPPSHNETTRTERMR
jgi:hypothetical protein